MNNQMNDFVDFNSLVKNPKNTKLKLSLNFQSKMIDQMNIDFTNNEQRWFIANLYCYLHYHPTNDFPINLENVYKMIGFTTKSNAKRSLLNNFTENEDYKITIVSMNNNRIETLLIPRDEQKNEKRGGHNEETIMLNIDTFKSLCMIVKTDKAKDIRKYYIKLENIYNKLINEERLENQKELEQKDQKLQEKEQELENTKKQLEIKTKLAVKKWYDQEPGDTIYALKSNKNDINSLITIGKSKNIKKRESGYFTCNQGAEMFYIKKCYNCDLAEKVLHHILDKYREESNKEWFNISEELSIYAIDTICDFLDMFINCSEKLPEFKIKEFLNNLPIERFDTNNTDNKIINEIKQIEEQIEEEKTERKKEKCTSKYIGVCFVHDRNNWCASLTINGKKTNLGYYNTELEAAKIYNDYALYINNTMNKKYKLNKIDNYITNPRNIPEERKLLFESTQSSSFKGVHYDNEKKHYNASIYFNNETLHLCCNNNEIECAKIYNQQALYYNNIYNTNYILNDIPDYITIPKDIHTELRENYLKNKSSKWIGVNKRKNGIYRSYLKFNDKQCHIGDFKNEIDAAKVYNDYALYLNQIYQQKYILNDIPDYITIPRNVPEDNKKLKVENKISKFTGLSYNSNKNLYSCSINFSNKNYLLGYSNEEVECAKLYNQQALYFNNNFNTEYILNDIPDYITIAKNVHEEYEKNRLEKKSSVYYGVNKLPDGRYRALLVFNKKQLKLGNFTNEIDAAKCYNNKAMELNKDFNKSYKINMF